MTSDDPARIAAIRRFSRFYTRRIGALAEGLLQSGFPLTEARVLYELAHHAEPTASDISAALDLDPGYLSRILTRFEQQGLLDRKLQAEVVAKIPGATLRLLDGCGHYPQIEMPAELTAALLETLAAPAA